MSKKQYPELVELFYKFNQSSKINLDKELIFNSLKKKGFLDDNGNPILNADTLNLIKTIKSYEVKGQEYK
ncbi:hypothetical protein J2Z60_000072 [Lactobacillus colini]|uniref:Uncharacterized protein n=1 Tax=Lactobacillus colini TaxID=1819254 RepID=A0ABS4MB59_9LACO|nr:hypothetical protein [Lactobacillus colini]MBP2056910.1 hypothetical protein [Lactobacillus colini]